MEAKETLETSFLHLQCLAEECTKIAKIAELACAKNDINLSEAMSDDFPELLNYIGETFQNFIKQTGELIKGMSFRSSISVLVDDEMSLLKEKDGISEDDVMSVIKKVFQAAKAGGVKVGGIKILHKAKEEEIENV